MCGIVGIAALDQTPIRRLQQNLQAMGQLVAHRGPNGHGQWEHPSGRVGLGHRRLSIIDLSAAAAQPMHAESGNVISFNGEIYNYLELQKELQHSWQFRSNSDTETVLASYEKHGVDCLTHLRGMFAFVLWDEAQQKLFCARDRFGIKPFYYTEIDGKFYFASEIKALLPFIPAIATDAGALAEYITFQYTLTEQTLFKGIKQLMPGHALEVKNGQVRVWRYWDICYQIDFDHNAKYYEEKLRALLQDSIAVHLRSDVPVGSYVSGGIDSSLIAIMAGGQPSAGKDAFHGKFTGFPGYDESPYAEMAAERAGLTLRQIDMTADDFRNNINKIIYHLDHPVAGPGAFPQYMVSGLAARHVRVVLGGQGGDEIFGGYARYLIGYFEQCIKAAIDGTYRQGHFVVTPESIIPNLSQLQEYKPLLRQFFAKGMFGPMDERYFRLIDRSTDMEAEFDWTQIDRAGMLARFKSVFNSAANVQKTAYFDSMTHFDFKCLLPALLQVEDRMGMAHGLESRVPFLDHALVEFAATIPADVKFKDGRMKHLLRNSFKDLLPRPLLERRDKMGFPVPLKEWFEGPLKDMVGDIFGSERARHRPFMNPDGMRTAGTMAEKFSRKSWGLLSLELWYQQFHDQEHKFKALAEQAPTAPLERVAG